MGEKLVEASGCVLDGVPTLMAPVNELNEARLSTAGNGTCSSMTDNSHARSSSGFSERGYTEAGSALSRPKKNTI